MKRYVFPLVTAAFLSMNVANAQLAGNAKGEAVDPDGTLHVSGLSVPLSIFLSPEARSYMLHLLRDKPFSGGPSPAQDIKGYRARQDEIMNWFLKPIRDRYPVNVEHKTIAGIYTDVVTPKGGVAPKNMNRVLLNVHGGGFISGARTAALVESIPIASVEKIKVITIDYRMGPEYKFPAASEDVAAVYQRGTQGVLAPAHRLVRLLGRRNAGGHVDRVVPEKPPPESGGNRRSLCVHR